MSRLLIRAMAIGLAASAAFPWTLYAQSEQPETTVGQSIEIPTESLSPARQAASDPNIPFGWDRQQMAGVARNVLMYGLIGILPIVALMATSYVRLVIVLGILRQAIGGTHTPPPQVMTALAMLLTVVVMMPVWHEIKREAVDPYLQSESPIGLNEALERGVVPLKRFMSRQIIAADSAADVWLFYKYMPEGQRQPPKTFSDVPMHVLLPAFLMSELKMAFAIGFQIFLPFLLVDLIVTSVTTSMGMIMVPPATISLPLKLALFVMVDGWHLMIGMLLQSFAGAG